MEVASHHISKAWMVGQEVAEYAYGLGEGFEKPERYSMPLFSHFLLVTNILKYSRNNPKTALLYGLISVRKSNKKSVPTANGSLLLTAEVLISTRRLRGSITGKI